MLEFEWDEAKAATNLKKHGVAFQDAAMVFFDPYCAGEEDRFGEYGEIRLSAVGFSGIDLLTVIYTQRGEVIRLISARRANRNETQVYGRNRGGH